MRYVTGRLRDSNVPTDRHTSVIGEYPEAAGEMRPSSEAYSALVGDFCLVQVQEFSIRGLAYERACGLGLISV